MELQFNKNELIAWLRTIAGATILSVSLIGQMAKLETNITSPIKLAAAFEQKVDFLDEGPYLVKYEAKQPQSHDDEDLPYSTFAMAITFRAELSNHPGRFIGGYDTLIRELSDFEYLAKIGSGPTGPLGHLLVSIPQDPIELGNLQQVLEKNSIFYAFPDGSGTLNLGNLKMGKGLRS